jgi:hypothetical protein
LCIVWFKEQFAAGGPVDRREIQQVAWEELAAGRQQ